LRFSQPYRAGAAYSCRAVALTIAVLSQKGGTGKTTMARSLVDVFQRLGLRTLAVDGDPQGNLSDYFDTDPAAHPTLGEVLAGQAKAVDAIHGDVIPANLGLAVAELILSGKMGRELTLRNALREAKRRYDVVVIDCPPTLGLLTVNALCAADRALLSTEAEYFSLQGVEQALEVITLARENLNPELEVLGIVLNIANMRTKHARQTLETLREHFGDYVFDTVIRRSIAYAESAERAIPILRYRPDRGVDYLRLSVELFRRLDMPERSAAVEELETQLMPAEARRAPSGDAVPSEPAERPVEAIPIGDEPAANPPPEAPRPYFG
jgi:chromosome partitioning protein